GLYKYAVAIVSIIAVIMVMVGGLRWLTAGGSATAISAAKETISGATVGLTLLLGSYLVLYTINPALVNFKALQIQSTERSLVTTPETSETVLNAESPAESSDWVPIAGDNIQGGISKAERPLVDLLQRAAQQIRTRGCSVVRASGARKGTSQLGSKEGKYGVKYKCQWSQQDKTYVSCNPAMGSWGSPEDIPRSTTCKYLDPDTPDFSDPKTASKCNPDAWIHYNAIDAWAADSSGGNPCGKVDCITAKCQRELIRAITANGGCILLGRNIETDRNPNSPLFEPWHFQLSGGGCFRDADKIMNSLGGQGY
ncbi:MAG: pilin, partial [Candidatus Brocadiia bacterium]